MGSAWSKNAEERSSSSSSSSRLTGARIFVPSCFRPSLSLSDYQVEEEGVRSKTTSCLYDPETESEIVREACLNVAVPPPNKVPLPLENDHKSTTMLKADKIASSSSTDADKVISRSLSNNSTSSRAHFGFLPNATGFRLRRAASLSSYRGACSLVSGIPSFSNSEGTSTYVTVGSGCSSYDINSTPENESRSDVVANDLDYLAAFGVCNCRNHSNSESIEMDQSLRTNGPRDSTEGSIRYSRTRSIGRLRDRVVQRTSHLEGVFGSLLLEDRLARSGRPIDSGRASGGRTLAPSSNQNESRHVSGDNPSRVTGSTENNHGYSLQTSHPVAVDNHNSSDNRLTFLERRRTIKSQLRALRRLGSGFEHLPGHERSCILLRQYQTGWCTCRVGGEAVHSNDDSGTRANISRIVMLAETLFQVLEDIHRQSEGSSSQPIRNVPAPKEIVDRMPLKIHRRLKKQNKEDSVLQCYICLVEYDEGDCLRVLPCLHQFHRACIDKWLKEIHRVCPLCRGDVCRMLGALNLS